MFATNNGQGPGEDTPEKTKRFVTGHSDKPQKTTNSSADFKSKIVAVYARLTGAASMIDLALALMVAQFVLIVWGAK